MGHEWGLNAIEQLGRRGNKNRSARSDWVERVAEAESSSLPGMARPSRHEREPWEATLMEVDDTSGLFMKVGSV